MAIGIGCADGSLLYLSVAPRRWSDNAYLDGRWRASCSPFDEILSAPSADRVAFVGGYSDCGSSGPQSAEHNSNSTTEGIDIVMSVDVSGSMLARDFTPDRLGAAKEVASNFIMDRPNDRIGLVVFAGESFTQCPLTTDKRSLLSLLGSVKSGMIDDGTAIGNGLATAVNRLRESQAKSKVIILLTDGVNNSGQIAPLTAAEIAQSYGIRVYTVGVGTMGMAPYPAIDMWGHLTFQPMKVEIDEKMLTEIAEMTGGKYFRATDNRRLKDVYDEINQLERSRVEVENFTHYQERFTLFAILALVLLIGEFVLRQTWLRRLP